MKKTIGFATMLVALCVSSVFTSCSKDDDEDVIETVNLEGLKAIVQTDGTVVFEGNVKSNSKITKFELRDSITEKVVYDFYEKDAQIKEKGEDGKEFTLNVKSEPVSMDKVYILYVKTKGEKEDKAQLGRSYKFTIGNAYSNLGSYLSFIEGKCYTLNEAKNNPKSIDAVVKEDCSLKVPSEAASSDINKSGIKAIILQNVAVITTNNLIATYKIENITSDGYKDGDKTKEMKHATISGIVFDSKTVTVDYSNVEKDMK